MEKEITFDGWSELLKDLFEDELGVNQLSGKNLIALLFLGQKYRRQ